MVSKCAREYSGLFDTIPLFRVRHLENLGGDGCMSFDSVVFQFVEHEVKPGRALATRCKVSKDKESAFIVVKALESMRG